MSTTDRPATGNATEAAAVAEACREADLCHLVVRADGDAIAAAALLARACDANRTPYHASFVRTRDALEARLDALDRDARPVVLGAAVRDLPSIAGEEPTSLASERAAREVARESDPVTAMAGVVASGDLPGDDAATVLDRAGIERRPGIAAPTDDPVEGLAHTTLAHSEFSADTERAQRAINDLDVEGLDAEARRRLASLLAISVAGDPDLSDRAAETVERALRPHAIDGPVATLEGYADVLSALAVEAPGLGFSLALGADVEAPALTTWREHGSAAHGAVRTAKRARYDGLLVAHVDGPVETTARLLRDFRSPEPIVIAIDGREVGLATVDPIGEVVANALDRVEGSGLYNRRTGFARVDDPDALVEALKEER